MFEQHGGLTSPVDTLPRTKRLKNPTATAKDDPQDGMDPQVRLGHTCGVCMHFITLFLVGHGRTEMLYAICAGCDENLRRVAATSVSEMSYGAA
ncbi:MAG TPA: hypothetical protein VOA64_00115 [Candidatus Dormibacteraeota bacterium]|nr:hypothetical protein [Candidatus Dormibacteraeota bacterium]